MALFQKLYLAAAILFCLFCAFLGYFISEPYRWAVGIGAVVFLYLLYLLYLWHKNYYQRKNNNYLRGGK